MACRVTLVMLATALATFGQGVDPQGIFVTPGTEGNSSRPAVKYSIKLNHDGELRAVAKSYHFQTGDRFLFQFELNQPGYVYLLQREIEGNPDTMERYVGAKGIVVVRDDEKKRPTPAKYQLLWPASGEDARISGRKPQSVPGHDQFFQFDNRPGLEKIVLLVSPKPVDIERAFPGSTNAPQRDNGKKRNDSDDDVLGQLSRDLEAMDSNTASSDAAVSSKGICVGECDSYSAPRKPSDPFMVVIDLRHFQ